MLVKQLHKFFSFVNKILNKRLVVERVVLMFKHCSTGEIIQELSKPEDWMIRRIRLMSPFQRLVQPGSGHNHNALDT